MDMQTIIKNKNGQEVINKMTGEVAKILGVGYQDNEFYVNVGAGANFETLNFMQFVMNWNLEFTLENGRLVK
jgi:hypothetical protein